MGIKGNLMLFVCLLVCLSMPGFATTDLTAYTLAGNYVTPAYGTFLGNDYDYTYNGVDWNTYGSDVFERNGLYYIFNAIDRYSTNAGIKLKASFAGTVYFCVDSDLYGSSQTNCQLLGSYTTPSSFQSMPTALIDLKTLVSTQGGSVMNFYYKIIYNGGGSADSWKYTAYWNVDNLFNKYNLISISSTSNLSSGVVTITLNSTVTRALNDSGCIIYDNDGQELTLSGTRSCLLFTDSTKAFAYPYYIESYYGGFYNYSRYNSSSLNTTVIKIFINENVTSKGIYMYYNTTTLNGTPIAVALQGQYNTTYRADENNNPFVIHQIFADWRWNQSFAYSLFPVTHSYLSRNYVRSQSIGFQGQNGGGAPRAAYANVSLFLNNVSDLYYNPFSNYNNFVGFIQRNTSYIAECSGTTLSITKSVLYNSTYSNVSLFSGAPGAPIFHFGYSNNFINITRTDSYTNIALNESITRIDIANITLCSSGTSGHNTTLRYVYNYNNISTTNTIYTPTNTTPLNLTAVPIVSLNAITPIDTRLNRIPLYFDIVTSQGGTAYCDVFNSTLTSNSVTIPDSGITDYNLVLYLDYTNQTEYFNLNNSYIQVKCNYITSTYSVATDYRTIFFDNELIYIANVSPIHYYNYSATNIPFSMNFAYNYNTSEHRSVFNYGYGLLNCTDIWQGKCIRYSYYSFSWFTVGTLYTTILGATIPSNNETVNPINYANANLISTYSTLNNCYELRFWFTIDNTTETGNISGYEINNQVFCIGINDVIDGSGTGGTPGNTTSDINTWLINSLLSNSLQCYTNYTPSGSWDVIPHFNCAVSTIGYKMVTIMNSPQAEQLYLAFMIVFFSWFSFAMYTGFIIGNKIRRGDTDLKTCLGIGVLFEVVFILGGLSSLNLLNIIFLLLSCGILYLVSKR